MAINQENPRGWEARLTTYKYINYPQAPRISCQSLTTLGAKSWSEE